MSDRYAVCVGNNYPGTPYELAGCVNDAHDWATVLDTHGYQVRLMLEPTRTDLLAVLAATIGRVGWGDRFVFTFSGHGTWVPDTDGDEADRRDEALVAADLGLITDDEIQRVMARLAHGAGGLILSDSCHSGTVSRFVNGDLMRNVAGDYAPPGAPLQTRPSGAPKEAKARFLPPTAFSPGLSPTRAAELEQLPPSKPRPQANLISGAKDDEYAYDAWFQDASGEWRANGAFTRAAVDCYTPGQSLARWYRNIRATLPNVDYPQTPQLTTSSLYRRYAVAL
jgi:metacaspase-1